MSVSSVTSRATEKTVPLTSKVERQESRKTTNVNHPNWTDFTIKIEIKCDATTSTSRVETEKPKAAGPAPTEAVEE